MNLATTDKKDSQALFIKNADIHFINPPDALAPGDEKPFDVRIRYRQKLQKALLVRTESGLYILFEEPQRGITPGQIAARYAGEELVGSGVIDA